MSRVIKTDFLVIGAGIAGLSFALKAARYGTVALIAKNEVMNSNTAWAQGGISAVLGESLREKGDTCETHVADTLDAGAGLCDESVVRTIIGEGEQTIQELIDCGVEFDLNTNEKGYSLGQEGGHTQRRVLHSKDTTGKEIVSSLMQALEQEKQISFYQNFFAIDLITSGKLGAVTDDRVLGSYVLDQDTGEVVICQSDRVVLATGGSGKTYLYTTNPDSATGDGVAMAWRARADIANMEFVQFHPTCFYNPGATGAKARSFLVSEAVRGEGAILIDQEGLDFMKDYDSRGSLAPRDVVARAIDSELKKTGAPCVYLDINPIGERFSQRFPFIESSLQGYGYDLSKGLIPVVPAAHYQCGGVLTDVNGRTSLRGLFAIGEVACTGLHGANRLASNSLLEGHVMARRALNELIRLYPVERKSTERFEIPKWEYGDTTSPDELVNIYHNWDELRRAMWDYVSIVRTDKRLRRAATRLQTLRKEVQEFYWGYRINADILELRNLVTVASLIVDSAIRRKESRGVHHTLDYPDQNERFLENTVLRKF